jgi:putative CocE/NonD family hydrolase
MRPLVLPVLLLCGLACPGLSQPAPEQKLGEFMRASYTKYEYMMPMRDGVRLFTALYVPKDAGPEKQYPILLFRTPYSVPPYGSDSFPDDGGIFVGVPETLIREKFIVALSDVRGCFMSEGEFVDVRPYKPRKGPQEIDESSDAFDTVDWLVKNAPFNNGKVGMWGLSYPGFYAAMAAIEAHPALVAVSPQAPVSDWYLGDDFHHNGAMFVAHAFNFYSIFGFGRPRPRPSTKFPERLDVGTADGYRFFLEAGPLSTLEPHVKGMTFWHEAMAHETYDGFWKERNVRPYLKGVRPAVMTVGGWFDAEDLFGALGVYRAIETQGGTNNRLVMGPWNHGAWAWMTGDRLGDVTFGQKTSEFYREKIELPFFVHHLKGGADPKLPEAYVFETGRNQWRTFDAWPPVVAKPVDYYLSASGTLSTEKPSAEGAAFDEYVSDPAKPVPVTMRMDIGMPAEYMTDDQRFAARRPDVLVYQTGRLEGDVTVAGPLVASLFVSTTGTDSDWVVKLIDVYSDDYPLQPDEVRPGMPEFMQPMHSRMGGYQQLVRGEPFRGKFRKSFEKPEPFTPGQVEKVEFTLPDVFHTFRRGHRIMVQVQSSWFPLVNLNPQRFVNIHEAKPEDFQKATQRVWRSSAFPSRVQLRVLP